VPARSSGAGPGRISAGSGDSLRLAAALNPLTEGAVVSPSYLMPDVIVCIPGITGSVLRKDGRDVWNISGSAVFNALRTLGGNLKDLKLEDDPVDVDDVDGIQATSVIRDVHLIPGIWQIDGYTKLVNHIKEKFAVKEGDNLFEFPYDWRRDNRVASRQLATKAKGWLDAWRTKSGNPDAKLIVIGHSMGGLVARHFLECREGWRDTRQLITIATPYGGALGSVGTLVNGKKIKFFDLTDVSRSMTALHQLLPIYPCYDDGSGTLQRIAEATVPNIDPEKAKAALAFHMEIRSAVEQHLKDQEYLDNRYDIRPIVGIEQPTAQSALLKGNKVELLNRHGTEDLMGDGTVPRPSATPAEFEAHQNEIYGAERHASLQNDDDVLFQLNGILTQPTFNPGDYRSAVAKVGQRLDLVDWATPAETITVRAQPLGDPGGLLVASVQNVDTGEEVSRTALRDSGDGWFEAELTLAEGIYRVTSLGGSVEPVTDLVTVVDE
jgi:pimeloyl-ACP methyl ester carboxylesterase